jgi:hypothetical protein
VSELFSRVLYPFEIARRPRIEPEVRRAILNRWSSSMSEVTDNPGPEGHLERPVEEERRITDTR